MPMSKNVENSQNIYNYKRRCIMESGNPTRKRTILFLIVISLILTFLLSLSMAWYIANRSASGTVIFDKGIFIDFNNVDGEGRERTLVLSDGSLFDISIVPNQVVEIKNPYIKALDNSVPFYLRAKLNYFTEKDGNLTVVTKDKLSQIIKLNPYGNAFDFNSNFLPDDTNEWFYFVKDVSMNLSSDNLAVVNPNDVVNIFESSTMTIANFKCEVGSPNEVDNLVVKLEIHALQASEESVSEFGLSKSNSALTTLSLSGGEVKYKSYDDYIEILEFKGTDIVINDDTLPITNKEIGISDTAFENVGLNEAIEEKVLFVYDKELIEYFVENEKFRTNSFIGVVDIATSEELYNYVFDVLLADRDGDFLAEEFITYNFILCDTDLQ